MQSPPRRRRGHQKQQLRSIRSAFFAVKNQRRVGFAQEDTGVRKRTLEISWIKRPCGLGLCRTMGLEGLGRIAGTWGDLLGSSTRLRMLHRNALLAASLLHSAALVRAQQITGLSDAELHGITERGRMLAEYDAAAWHASDAVMALKPGTKNLGRYIAKKTDAGWVVVFGQLNEAKDTFLVAYAAIPGKHPAEYHAARLEQPQEDAACFLFAAKAIKVALPPFQPPNRPYNLPPFPPSSNQISVYII